MHKQIVSTAMVAWYYIVLLPNSILYCAILLIFFHSRAVALTAQLRLTMCQAQAKAVISRCTLAGLLRARLLPAPA